MLEQLLIHQPEDPISFMITHLRRNNDNGEHSLQCGVAAAPSTPHHPDCGPEPSVLPVPEWGSEQNREERYFDKLQ
jgi:hypothetical protein